MKTFYGHILIFLHVPHNNSALFSPGSDLDTRTLRDMAATPQDRALYINRAVDRSGLRLYTHYDESRACYVISKVRRETKISIILSLQKKKNL